MGVFDTVMVACPKCGYRKELQSKSGMCGMDRFELADAPPDVMGGILADGPYECPACKNAIEIRPSMGYVAVSSRSLEEVRKEIFRLQQVARSLHERHGDPDCPICREIGS